VLQLQQQSPPSLATARNWAAGTASSFPTSHDPV